jgi:hypothetical protein
MFQCMNHIARWSQIFTTFKVLTTLKTLSVGDTENWCALFKRTIHQVQYFSIWGSFIARRMPKLHSMSRQVFSSVWGATEATALLVRIRSSNHTTTFWTEYLVLYTAPKKINGFISIKISPTFVRRRPQNMLERSEGLAYWTILHIRNTGTRNPPICLWQIIRSANPARTSLPSEFPLSQAEVGKLQLHLV